ncbi:MAG: 2-C-methyl-D-erythritol 4-phosphate cytidylyltransferase [Peptococcaceae bacterium]|nr:2-C-methyl-D-erythritol 4-phosphate cytidylyltransferase [Peptococcaceae bacterium]
MGEVAAVVPAAGSGSRMGLETKKQYLPLAGIPVLGHVLKALEASPVIQGVVVVAGSGEEEYCRLAVIDKLGIRKVKAIVPGGKERQDSVYSGLLALSPAPGIVVVHDGARPLLSAGWLEAVVKAAEEHGAATLAVPVKETVKLAGEGGFVARTVPRERLWLAQTPQAFRYGIILEAHRRARREHFTGTDDAALVEQLGLPVKIVPGSYENIKITTPEDLLLASAIIEAGRR